MARYLLHSPTPLGVTVDLNKADFSDFYINVEIPKDPNNVVFANTFKEILKVFINRVKKGYDLPNTWESFKDSALYESIEQFINKEYNPLNNTTKELFRILKSLDFEPFYWNGFSIYKDSDAVYVTMDEDNDDLPRLICYLDENTYYTVSYFQKTPCGKVDPEELKSKREEFYSYFFEKDQIDHYLCDYSDHEYSDGTYNVTVGINANTGDLVKFQNIVLTNDSFDCERSEYQVPYWISLYDNFSKDIYDIECCNGKILVIRVDSTTKPNEYNDNELDHEFKYIIVRYNSTLDWVQVYYHEINASTNKSTGEWIDKPSFNHDYLVEYVDEKREINNLEKYYKIVKGAVKNLPEKSKQLIKLLGGKKRITVSDLNDLCDENKPYSYLRSTYLTTEMKLILAKKLYVDRPIFAIKESALEWRRRTGTDCGTKELVNYWQALFPKDSIYVTYEAVYDLLVGDSKAANAQIMGKAYIGELDPFANDPDSYEKAKRRREAILNRIKPVVFKPGDVNDEPYTLFNDDFYCYPDTRVSFLVNGRTVKFSRIDTSKPFILRSLVDSGKCWIKKNASGLKPKALNSFYSMDEEAWSVEESRLKE